MAEKNYTPYQQKIIKRYYDNMDGIQWQRLADLVAELYLAEGKKKDRLWKNAAAAMEKLKVPKDRIEHPIKMKKPELVAQLLERYRTQNRELRACEPRDLIERARDICRFRAQPLELSDEVLNLAWTGYFGNK